PTAHSHALHSFPTRRSSDLKQHGGAFVLRIEDTDAARNRPEWIEGILDALDWLGIRRGSYEGPYLQSSYAAEHRAAGQRLHEAGDRKSTRLNSSHEWISYAV